MAYTAVTSSHSGFRSGPLEPAGRWYEPVEGTAVHHAPRRMQHVYVPDVGSLVVDAGSYRRGTVHHDHYSTSSPSSGHHASSAGYRRPGSRHPSGHHREALGSTANPPSTRSTSSSCGRTGRVSSHSKASSMALATQPHTPEIPRLSTPELAPVSAGIRFCPCCMTETDRIEEHEYLHGRAMMDSQIQYAMAHMSRTSRKGSARLIKN